MYKKIIAMLLVASTASAMDIYSRVYVAKTDTTLTSVFDEIKATPDEREEILRLNPGLRRMDRIAAGTILNLTLYRGTNNTVTSNLKKLKVEDKRVVENILSVGPLLSLDSVKTGLNNDAEIQTSNRSYGVGVNYEIPQNSFFGLNLFSQLTNVDFANVKVKQQTGQDKTIDGNESRFNYDVGIKGMFNRTSLNNRFAVFLSRKVDNLYDYSKDKTFYSNDPSEYVAISRFAGWWSGAEFTQILPLKKVPLEAGIGYSFIMDGNVTSEDSSKVRSLNGSRSSLSLTWRNSDAQAFGVKYQNFSYRSEFNTTVGSLGLFADFKI